MCRRVGSIYARSSTIWITITIVLTRAIGTRESYYIYTRACCIWLPFFPVTAENCWFSIQCGEVDFSLVHRAPTTTVTSIDFNGSTHCSSRTWRGCFFLFFFFFSYINARNVSTSSVSERNSAVDRVLRIRLPRSSDPESRVALRVDCIYRLTPPGCSFPCTYVHLVTIEFSLENN